MNEVLASGSARLLGDDINTDYIVPSHRKKETIDPQVLRAFVFEDIHPGFYEAMGAETILVAGTNFGCGSAMEVAVTVLQAAGVKAVIAKSFSRTFRRNALNNGLLLCQADATHLNDNDAVTVGLENGTLTIDTNADERIKAGTMPAFMLEMLSHGGLTRFLMAKGGFE
ncbi:alpha-IPM isomerase [Pseudohalocynthiibacter aestuariivivens]|uniref:3-isopropylmalate dehydratase n=1 Tax=Roseovarius pelagicus TaxID=2980108 RepID=A0ABY6DEL7_9RHOB|nr:MULTISPECIES: alpha-IPM isomerase [Rhodobacterales]QIE46853.1 alpha-IPM isomerase [Pseudohalocynthiibacter aestuariivivens]UXX84602.1 3-isopropylmalate dehydratase [Roseovarius pelagicus]